jgi:LysM repeat protein
MTTGARLWVAALASLAFAALAAACGGDDSSADTTTMPPLTTTTTTPQTSTTLSRFYEVQPGDSLFSIAESFDVRIEDLIEVNGITDPDLIQAGEKLEIPPPTVMVTPTAATTAPPATFTTSTAP